MLIAYHAKNDNHEWHHVITAPHDDPTWSGNQNQFAINHMLETGVMVLTMGWNMWQIVKSQDVKK
jgi:hypothetical protein